MNRKLYKESGMSLIELMIAIAIGSVLMIGLVASFKSSSDAKRELERSGQLIENGRYATGLLSEDIRLAGYYGAYFTLDNPPSALPDPCIVPNSAANIDAITAAMALPIQGYDDTSISTTSCDDAGGLLPSLNVQPGTDILVIRRASTVESYTADEDSLFLVANASYLRLAMAASGTDLTTNAWNTFDGQLRGFTPTVIAGNPLSSAWGPEKNGQKNLPESRKYILHIYFVSRCRFGSGANGVCTASEPESNMVPTLKRLEFKGNSMQITPLVEGIEHFNVEYGVDNIPPAKNLMTGYSGDGITDTYVTTPAAVEDWQKVVSVKVYLIARTLTETSGYTDQKSFSYGSAATINVAAANDSFRRNLFTAEVRPTNMAGRREIPQ